MRNVVLTGDVVFAESKNSRLMGKLLTKANESKAAKYYTFFLSSGPKTNGVIQLMGTPTAISRAFLAEPEDFCIEISDKSHSELI